MQRAVETVSGVQGTDIAGMVFKRKYLRILVIVYTGVVGRIMPEISEHAGVLIVTADPLPRGNPNQMAYGLYSEDTIVYQRVLIGRIMDKTFNPVSVISVQSIYCAKPHKPFSVLRGTGDLAIRKPLIFRQIAKLNVREILCQPAMQVKESN